MPTFYFQSLFYLHQSILNSLTKDSQWVLGWFLWKRCRHVSTASRSLSARIQDTQEDSSFGFWSLFENVRFFRLWPSLMFCLTNLQTNFLYGIAFAVAHSRESKDIRLFHWDDDKWHRGSAFPSPWDYPSGRKWITTGKCQQRELVNGIVLFLLRLSLNIAFLKRWVYLQVSAFFFFFLVSRSRESCLTVFEMEMKCPSLKQQKVRSV